MYNSDAGVTNRMRKCGTCARDVTAGTHTVAEGDLTMGMFSNRCQNPDCGARVKKRANFCSRCGWAGEGSLTKCDECGKRVGRTSRFCWNCGADIAASKPPRIVGNRWVRDEEEIAVRIYPEDVKGITKRYVTVEPGTVGVIERNGKFVKEREYGTEVMDSFLRLRKPESIILIMAGDIVLRPTFAKLHDANYTELDVTVQVVLRINDYDTFVRQYFQGHKRRVTYSSFESSMSHELENHVRSVISSSTIEDMYGNEDWREGFESKLRNAMTVTLSRNGLELVQVNFVDFGGDRYEELLQERGEVERGNHAADFLGEKVAIQRRVAQLQAEGKLDQAKAGKELAVKVREMNNQCAVRAVLSDSEREEAVEQAWHELELKNHLRQYELEDLEDEHARQQQQQDVAEQMELEKLQTEHQNEIAMAVLIGRNKCDGTRAEFEREQGRLSAENRLDIEWKESEQHRRDRRADAVQNYELLIEESRSNLEIAKNKTSQRLSELEAEKAEKMAAQENDAERQKLKIEYDRHQAELLRQMQAQEQEGLKITMHFDLEKEKLKYDSERISRIAVAEATEKHLNERLEEAKEYAQAQRSAGDKRADDLKEMAGIIAKNQAQAQPGVVMTGQPGVGAVAGGGQSPCPNCGRQVAYNDDFCRKCGHDMRAHRGS